MLFYCRKRYKARLSAHAAPVESFGSANRASTRISAWPCRRTLSTSHYPTDKQKILFNVVSVCCEACCSPRNRVKLCFESGECKGVRMWYCPHESCVGNGPLEIADITKDAIYETLTCPDCRQPPLAYWPCPICDTVVSSECFPLFDGFIDFIMMNYLMFQRSIAKNATLISKATRQAVTRCCCYNN